LFPYIYTCAREAHETGLPIMRAMVLEYPGDNTCYALDDQFMFGPALLVAPVVKKNSQVRRIYLPEGQWYDFHQPELIYEGQQWIDYAAPLEKIPILVKRGSIIPMMPVMQYIHEKQDYPLTLQVFPGPEKTSSEFLMYEDDGVTL